MRQRYQKIANWYKGNTHIHSTKSDGGLDFDQLSARYSQAGYDFLFRTDHWVCSNVAKEGGSDLLAWFDGVELDGFSNTGVYYHIVCLGSFEPFERARGLEAAVRAAKKAGGVVILAHPHWTGNAYDDALSLPVDGVEVLNYLCQMMNGKGWSGFLWDALLETKPELLGIASDDAHINEHDPGWNGGWIKVNAQECTQPAILEAIRAGEFYGSNGPDFLNIRNDGKKVSIETSPVKYLRLVGPRYKVHKVVAEEGKLLTKAEFDIPSDWDSVYLQIEDEVRRSAWTNNLFVP